MCTGEGSVDKIRTVKIPGKIHLLYWDLLWSDSEKWKEGDKETSPWIQ